MESTTPTPPTLLHHFFELAAQRHPHRIAVDVPPGPDRPSRSTITYAQLLTQSQKLAAHLQPHATTDAVIGMMLPRDSHLLYAAQLAVLQSGAAFTCIDPIFPDAFIQAVIDDGNIPILITDDFGLARITAANLRIPNTLDITALPPAPPSIASTTAPQPSNLAYLIYTSGTTGTPKGVMIEHRSIMNLVDSDLTEFRLEPTDRIAQGSSAAYDSSIEEIWLAFAAGATLVLLDDLTLRAGPDLVPWLANERITVFCPPPTLLRTTGCTNPAVALPLLRLLYVGGEALTQDLAHLWGEGRRLVNGYGPTECTVTVVRGDIHPNQPVTIGRPVTGHTAHVLNADLQPVESGQSGELCLSGPGLARGYKNRPSITADKFPTHATLGRIYRTGDLVQQQPDGQLLYLGRIDSQTKLRGYRIELEAIEARLATCTGILEAACHIQGEGNTAQLVAHVVPVTLNSPPNFEALKDALRRDLPHYMIPARFALIDSLPRSIGGKIDRKGLPTLSAAEPPGETTKHTRTVVAPITPTESLICDAFATALHSTAPISIHDDFFLDLAGDSLSAVGVICILREHSSTARITTRDLYEARTPAALSLKCAQPAAKPTFAHTRPTPSSTPTHPHWVTAAQGACILLSLLALSAAAYAIVFAFIPTLLHTFGVANSILLAFPIAVSAALLYTLFTIFITVILKRTLIGTYQPIRTPVWSTFYLRHWIVNRAASTIPWNILSHTVAYSAVLRLLGAKVGRRVHIHRGVNLNQGGWDLLTLGDDVTLNRDARIGLVDLDSGCLCIGPVTIHSLATLDTRASVSGHTTVHEGALLTALSWLPQDQAIPAGEQWNGVPAAPAGVAPSTPTPNSTPSLHPISHAIAHITAFALFRILPTLPALAILFTFARGLTAHDITTWLAAPTITARALLAIFIASTLWVPIWLILRALAVRALGRVTPATLPRWSFASIRLALKADAVDSAGTWLTGTLFWPWWLRLAGMRIGPDCEISTIIDVVPETLTIGPGSFFADGIYLAGPHHYRGTITIHQTTLGPGTFLGNHVIIPTGATLPENLFFGVCTVADGRTSRPGSAWFGHPALELPRRDIVDIDPTLTHNPGPLRYTNRLLWESLRFTIPLLPLSVAFVWLDVFTLFQAAPITLAFIVAPLATLAAITTECLSVIALKWLLLGRAKSGQHPLWSCWCSRWDFLYVAWQFYALRPLAALEGTLLLAIYLRAMGARIGRRVVLGPGLAQLADPDMITIEDDATVEANYQAHSFEDRVLKLAPAIVRKSATVGQSTVVFYGADIGEHCWVSPNSVVMKNERLAPNQTFSGCPVQPIQGTPPSHESSTHVLG